MPYAIKITLFIIVTIIYFQITQIAISEMCKSTL
jgi:hypothetical protein